MASTSSSLDSKAFAHTLDSQLFIFPDNRIPHFLQEGQWLLEAKKDGEVTKIILNIRIPSGTHTSYRMDIQPAQLPPPAISKENKVSDLIYKNPVEQKTASSITQEAWVFNRKKNCWMHYSNDLNKNDLTIPNDANIDELINDICKPGKNILKKNMITPIQLIQQVRDFNISNNLNSFIAKILANKNFKDYNNFYHYLSFIKDASPFIKALKPTFLSSFLPLFLKKVDNVISLINDFFRKELNKSYKKIVKSLESVSELKNDSNFNLQVDKAIEDIFNQIKNLKKCGCAALPSLQKIEQVLLQYYPFLKNKTKEFDSFVQLKNGGSPVNHQVSPISQSIYKAAAFDPSKTQEKSTPSSLTPHTNSVTSPNSFSQPVDSTKSKEANSKFTNDSKNDDKSMDSKERAITPSL